MKIRLTESQIITLIAALYDGAEYEMSLNYAWHNKGPEAKRAKERAKKYTKLREKLILERRLR